MRLLKIKKLNITNLIDINKVSNVLFNSEEKTLVITQYSERFFYRNVNVPTFNKIEKFMCNDNTNNDILIINMKENE